MFKNAKWICSYDNKNKDGSDLFYYKFEINKEVKQGKITVCGLGMGVYRMNGDLVTDEVMTTPVSRYDKTVYCRQWEITKLLRKGTNHVEAYIGNAWYNDNAEEWNFDCAVWKGVRKLIMEIEVILEDNTKIIIGTGSHWKTCTGPSIYNHTREGEIYDAQKAGKINNKNLWKSSHICSPPGGKLKLFGGVPIKVINRLQPEKQKGSIYDFGKNISGRLRIVCRGQKRGEQIVIDYAEKLNDEGTDIDNEKITRYMSGPIKARDIYICVGCEKEEWHSDFVYHGFRYVKVTSENAAVECTAEEIHADMKKTGYFSCSDTDVNEIHKAAVQTTLSNLMSIPTDCPHREQLGWTGDALAAARQCIVNYDMKRFYQKWLSDFKDVQRISGQLPGIVPTSSWGYEWGSGPAWDSALIQIPYEMYRMTGDDSLIRLMWQNMCRYMNYMEAMDEDGFVQYGLGDWCAPEDAHVCPTEVTDTCFYYFNMKVMAQCAEIISDRRINYFQLAAQRIKKAFRKKYVESDNEALHTQTGLAAMIHYELLEGDEYRSAALRLKKLVEDKCWHIDCGIIGVRCIFQALSDYGYAETVYKMITNPEKPSYAWWLHQGVHTFCENWEMGDSLNHQMFSEVDYWIYTYIAGFKLHLGALEIRPETKLYKVICEGRAAYRTTEIQWNKEYFEVTTDVPVKIVWHGKEYKLEKGNLKLKMEA